MSYNNRYFNKNDYSQRSPSRKGWNNSNNVRAFDPKTYKVKSGCKVHYDDKGFITCVFAWNVSRQHGFRELTLFPTTTTRGKNGKFEWQVFDVRLVNKTTGEVLTAKHNNLRAFRKNGDPNANFYIPNLSFVIAPKTRRVDGSIGYCGPMYFKGANRR